MTKPDPELDLPWSQSGLAWARSAPGMHVRGASGLNVLLGNRILRPGCEAAGSTEYDLYLVAARRAAFAARAANAFHPLVEALEALLACADPGDLAAAQARRALELAKGGTP